MSNINDAVYVKSGIGIVMVIESVGMTEGTVFYIQTATERVELRRFFGSEYVLADLYWEAIKKVVNG